MTQETFQCKLCRRHIPVDMRSREKEGYCMLCRGELPSDNKEGEKSGRSKSKKHNE